MENYFRVFSMFESLGDTDLDCTMPMVGERK